MSTFGYEISAHIETTHELKPIKSAFVQHIPSTSPAALMNCSATLSSHNLVNHSVFAKENGEEHKEGEEGQEKTG